MFNVQIVHPFFCTKLFKLPYSRVHYLKRNTNQIWPIYDETTNKEHRDLELMEPKVTWLTHSEGRKLVILL